MLPVARMEYQESVGLYVHDCDETPLFIRRPLPTLACWVGKGRQLLWFVVLSIATWCKSIVVYLVPSNLASSLGWGSLQLMQCGGY